MSDILNLSTLLDESKKLEDERNGISPDGVVQSSAMTPGDIGPAAPKSDEEPAKKRDPKAIWDEDDDVQAEEFTLFKTHLDPNDRRPEPEHDVLYSQSIGSQDAFFGMSDKDPSTMSCDKITVKVTLPDTEFKDIQLDVEGNQFLVRTPTHKLAIHLQQVVDDKKGNAKWDKGRGLLTVSLPIVRHEAFFHPSMDISDIRQ